MTSIPDLTPYTYGPPLVPGELAVGWIDDGDEIPTGELPKLLRRLVIERLTFAAAYLPSGLAAHMGIHDCAFCDGPKVPLPNDAFWGSGELRVIDSSRTCFVAPSMIAHYIAEHRYLPPPVFIEAVVAGQFVEQPRPELDRAVVDRVDDPPDDLASDLGATAVVHGHIEPWDRTPGAPLLGIAIARSWYGPWNGTPEHAVAVVAGEAIGFTP